MREQLLWLLRPLSKLGFATYFLTLWGIAVSSLYVRLPLFVYPLAFIVVFLVVRFIP